MVSSNVHINDASNSNLYKSFGWVAFNIFGANFDGLTASSDKSVPVVSALKEDKMNEEKINIIIIVDMKLYDERLVF